MVPPMSITPRWFSASLPLPGVTILRWGLSVSDTTPRADLLGLIADRLRVDGAHASSGSLIAAAALLDAQRWLLLDVLPVRLRLALAAEYQDELNGFQAVYPPYELAAQAPQRAVVEAALVGLAFANPALASLHDALQALPGSTVLEEAIDARGPTLDGEPLMQALRAPLEASPQGVAGQLAVALAAWSDRLPEDLRTALLRARDVVCEEQAVRGGGPGPAPVLTFDDPGPGPGPEDSSSARAAGPVVDAETEGFTPDRAWMPNVVLVAKQTHVWLDQLSRRFERPIRRLDEIPEEALRELAEWGFSGLWLIGVWQRSAASRDIKRRTGNPEALASAYALYDYVVADDLGGEAALGVLRDRAAALGLRLAADMVPNHVGVDGRWVVEHPDWFVQLDRPPYPGYRFDDPDLSGDSRAQIRLEHGYWDRTDAAVVFERLDPATGERRYIYHGNDGTHMPWNDTAQLDFLREDVREAVIGQVLAVARRFPIIRLDAAMTLARRHVQRLWHPSPGEGGAIPSRAEHGVDPATFDAAMPRELWREVVDRVNAEQPDTLLLAEAFWMMEGYFVRTLGMHRVYNSAFMNMLKAEDNAQLRETIANVLAFSPEVLLRFVNFMSNPDEETAVEQFGRGDKYFGAATLLVTLPGLPMFAHGQIGGLAEKYGMEYARAYRDERDDAEMVARHEREIFPLMRLRRLFSQVEDFALYDVIDGDDVLQQSVFAYSNRHGDERALVLYNNVYERTAGWVRSAVPAKRDDALVSGTLGESLGLDRERLYAFQEQRSGLWYLREGAALCDAGLFIALDGFECQVLLDWRVMPDGWRELAATLDGRGVPDLDAARSE